MAKVNRRPKGKRARKKSKLHKQKLKVQRTHSFLRMVPWFNKGEWEEVYEKIFSTLYEDRRWALNRIMVWKSRSHPVLPTGIEATEALVRAQLQDTLLLDGNASCQGSDISLLYSMALVRFVNLISELGKWTKSGTSSMRNIGLKMKIPGWLIDLRHNATHSIMPSLEMLRNGARFALDWLKHYYWLEQRETMYDWIPDSSTVNVQFEENDIARHLQIYLHFQKEQILSPRKEKGNPPRSPAKKGIRETMLALHMMLQKNPQQLICTLIRPGFLVPESLEALNLQGSDEQENQVRIVDEYEALWVPILSWIIRTKHVSTLLEELINYQASRKEVHCQLAMLWACKIIEVLITKGYPSVDPTGSLSRLSAPKPCTVQWKHLLRLAVLSANKLAAQTGFPIPSTKLQHMMSLAAIYLGMTLEKPEGTMKEVNNSSIYDNYSLESIRNSRNSEDFNSSGGWHLCEDPVDWSLYPLGVLANNAANYDCVHGLELSNKQLVDDDQHSSEESIQSSHFQDDENEEAKICVTETWNVKEGGTNGDVDADLNLMEFMI